MLLSACVSVVKRVCTAFRVCAWTIACVTRPSFSITISHTPLCQYPHASSLTPGAGANSSTTSTDARSPTVITIRGALDDNSAASSPLVDSWTMWIGTSRVTPAGTST